VDVWHGFQTDARTIGINNNYQTSVAKGENTVQTYDVYTSFSPLTKGILHVAFGSNKGDGVSCGTALTVQDVSTNDFVTYPQDAQNFNFNTQEGWVAQYAIQGTQHLKVTLTPYVNSCSQCYCSYLANVWVELSYDSVFRSPTNISLSSIITYEVPITKIEYFHSGIKIGESGSGQEFTWNGVYTGSYRVTAVATDQLGSVSSSPPLLLSVLGPIVTPSYPDGGIVYSNQGGVVRFSILTTTDGDVTSAFLITSGGRNVSIISGSFDFGTLSNGAVNYTIVTIDSLGAMNVQNLSFVVVAPPPPTPTSSSTSSATGNNDVQDGSSGSNNKAIIIGVVIGVIALVAIVVIVIVVVVVVKKRGQSSGFGNGIEMKSH